MGVFLNRTFDDGSVTALWRITDGEGKSLGEQRLAVDALIDSVFEGKYRLCHNEDGVPALEVADASVPFVSVSHTRGWAAVMTNPKKHVGIDIELADRNFSAVEKKSLCPAELSRLNDWAEVLRDSLASDADADQADTASVLNPRNTVLGLLWCAKEAVYKRLTIPATDFAEQIEIEAIEPASNGTTNPPQETRLDDPTTEGEITANFKYEDSEKIKLCLEYTIVSGLLLVYTK